jgi:hypothetical protein
MCAILLTFFIETKLLYRLEIEEINYLYLYLNLIGCKLSDPGGHNEREKNE